MIEGRGTLHEYGPTPAFGVFFGAVLIGLAVGELVYSAFWRMPRSPGAPIWARVLYVALPGYLAIVEPQMLKRVGWAVLCICAAASWLLHEHIVAASLVVSISFLQVIAGALFVRTSVSVMPARQRLLGPWSIAKVAGRRAAPHNNELQRTSEAQAKEPHG